MMTIMGALMIAKTMRLKNVIMTMAVQFWINEYSYIINVTIRHNVK
jgi:hypothetical protein